MMVIRIILTRVTAVTSTFKGQDHGTDGQIERHYSRRALLMVSNFGVSKTCRFPGSSTLKEWNRFSVFQAWGSDVCDQDRSDRFQGGKA